MKKALVVLEYIMYDGPEVSKSILKFFGFLPKFTFGFPSKNFDFF